jgi:hypothetical protein
VTKAYNSAKKKQEDRIANSGNIKKECSKNALSFLLLIMSSLQQNWKQRVGGERGKMTKTIYV